MQPGISGSTDKLKKASSAGIEYPPPVRCHPRASTGKEKIAAETFAGIKPRSRRREACGRREPRYI